MDLREAYSTLAMPSSLAAFKYSLTTDLLHSHCAIGLEAEFEKKIFLFNFINVNKADASRNIRGYSFQTSHHNNSFTGARRTRTTTTTTDEPGRLARSPGAVHLGDVVLGRRDTDIIELDFAPPKTLVEFTNFEDLLRK